MQDVHDMKDKSDDLTLDDRVRMLNDDQRRIFDNIKAHLFHQIKHVSGQCYCTCDIERVKSAFMVMKNY